MTARGVAIRKVLTSSFGLKLAAILLAGAGCGQAASNPKGENPGGQGQQGGTRAAGGAAGNAESAGAGGVNAEGGLSAGSAGEAALPCGVPATSQIRRLTNAQYERTVRDLLGVTSLAEKDGRRPSQVLAPDQDGDLTGDGLRLYLEVGEAIAAQVMATPEQRARFIECEFVGDGSACLRETIVEFGRRAFRRPLSVSELARFDKIVDARADITEHGTPDEVAEVLLGTFLVSPTFIQRAEVSEEVDASGRFVLSPYEVASRLSYTLWGSTPDDTLNRAADAGQLSTPEQLRRQGARMISDPKARELVAAFHRAYLRLDQGDDGPWRTNNRKDPTGFPGFSPAVVAAMTDETERFFDSVAFARRGSFQDLFQSPTGFVNADTAPIYGLEPSRFGSELEQVSLDPSQRPGFLTRLAFLSSFADPWRGSPSRRGAFIESVVMGLPLGPPHPDSFAGGPPGPELQTNRERVAALNSDVACAGCHRIVDPPGFVLEAYDAIGAWQTVEANGLSIDTVADVHIDDASPTVHDPVELMARLAGSWDAQRTYAKRWVAYAYQRAENSSDTCTADELAHKLADTGYAVLDLLVDLTQTESFRTRVREEP